MRHVLKYTNALNWDGQNDERGMEQTDKGEVIPMCQPALVSDTKKLSTANFKHVCRYITKHSLKIEYLITNYNM